MSRITNILIAVICAFVMVGDVQAQISSFTMDDIPSTKDTAKIMSGFIYRLTRKNDFNMINECLRNATDVSSQIYRVVGDIVDKEQFDLESIMIEVLAMIVEFDTKLMKCDGMKPEIEKINAWIGRFQNTNDFLDLVSKNVQENHMMIMTMGATMPVFIQKKEYTKVGETIADII